MKNYIITIATAVVIASGGTAVVVNELNNSSLDTINQTPQTSLGIEIKEITPSLWHIYESRTGHYYPVTSYEEIERLAFVLDSGGNRIKRKVDEDDDQTTIDLRLLIATELETKTVEEFINSFKTQ